MAKSVNPVTSTEPEVTHHGVLDAQVCVPTSWTDDEVIDFLERRCPCGTTTGWHIRREGSELLSGGPERVACEGRAGFVHVMLDA